MIYFVIAGIIFLLELAVKNKIEKTRETNRETEILKGALIIRKYHNRGAFLNLGEKIRPVMAAVSFILTLSVGAALCLVYGKKGNLLLKAGLSLVLGGALSNTYDRLKRKYVVDYFSFGVKWNKLRNIVFNISDFCIFIGAVFIVISGRTNEF